MSGQLPEGPECWQFSKQNYCRLLLKGSTRDQIDKVLSDLKRIQGPKQEQIMREFLNHENDAMREGVKLVKPKTLIDQERKYARALSKDEDYQEYLFDIGLSDKSVKKPVK